MTQNSIKTYSNNPVDVTIFSSDFFRCIADQLPCYICVFDRNGFLRYINPAMAKGIGAPDATLLIGKFNVHDWHGEDLAVYKLPQKLKEVLNGEVIFAPNVPAPVYADNYRHQAIVARQFASVCAFPIKTEDGSIERVGFLFFPHTVERSDPRVMRCCVWIDRNWMIPFDSDKLVEECSVSKSHLTKLFKQEFGISPFQYYRRVRMEHVRSRLCDTNLSVYQAFEVCGMKYNGSMASEFKKMFGMSPKAYRKYLKETSSSQHLVE